MFASMQTAAAQDTNSFSVGSYLMAPGQKNIILSNSGKFETEFLLYLNHRDAIKQMMCSSLLLLIIPGHFSNKGIMTGKLFEYLASGKPVLCIGPTDGDAAGILEATSHGKCAAYGDTEKIFHIIADYYKSGAGSFKEAPGEYSRPELTKRLVTLLKQLK